MRTRWALAVGTATLTVTALLTTALGVPALAAPATPAGLTAAIEDFQPYVGQSTCDPVAKPGVKAFMNLLLDTYPDTGSDGIVRDCGIGGQSEHKEGRAFDWQVSAASATDVKHVNEVTGWLLATDKYGNPDAMFRRLGLMYMIWNKHIWKGYQADKGWQPYSGASEHTDHVHFSFGWAGARQVTSYWTGKVAPIDYGPSGRPVVTPVRSPANIKIVATYGATTLQSGSTGAAVKVVQSALTITPDGDFGPNTQAAVSAFQKDQGLTATGTFGPTEWKRLFPPPLNPFGAVEHVDPSLGTTVVSGWGIDADQDVPLTVHIYVDGKVFGQTTESISRPDISAAYPGYPSAHGFRWVGTLADGTHNVCAYGINVSGTPGVNALLGCLPTVVQHSPVGRLDGAQQGPDGTVARGWALDPDVVDPVAMRLTLDGTALPGSTLANQARPDLLSRYPDYGSGHGFSLPITTTQGTHQVCAFAANATGTPGAESALGCRPLVVQHDPVGLAAPLATPPGAVIVSGQALDPDTAAATSVHVYVDGAFQRALPANLTSVALPAYPAYGAGHGYSTALALAQGKHTICSYALNGAGTPGGNKLISCQSVSVNHVPFGSFDSFAQQGTVAVPIRGWAVDPDSTSPVTVQVTVDGRRIRDLTADATRADIAAKLPSLGAAHGFGESMVLADGTHKVCLVYVNLTGTPGSNTAPTCRSLVVRHSPIGAAPTATRYPAGVVLRGWGLDLDTTAPITVRVMVDGTKVVELPASSGRADVAAAYPGYGTGHGYATAPLSMTEGSHRVCVVGVNATSTPGADTQLGCTSVTVSHGVTGAITKTDIWPDRMAVYGWALDRDSTQPVTVHVLLDGKPVSTLSAGLSRPELASSFPGYGIAHGWQLMLHPTKGAHAVCVRADNLAGTPGAGGSIGCRTVTF